MLPGAQNKAFKSMQVDERALIRVEAMIHSMTLGERANPSIINGSRRKRIAAGSGVTVQEINRLLNQFEMMKKMMKMMKHKGGGNRLPFGF
ncbi:MAG: Signal recognition particle protein [bacterium ADurb.Bin478]|nr:MAG: Signal recognition particle protein [bacterium ADurb.Bin478]